MDPKLQCIADYLLIRRERHRIDPLDIAPMLLPHFFILDVETQETPDIRLHIRLVGTALDTAFGQFIRGRYLEDYLHGPRSAEVLHGFRRCHTSQQPLWMRQVVRIKDKVPRFVEGVAVPVVPHLIYGGLTFGETSQDDELKGFICRPL